MDTLNPEEKIMDPEERQKKLEERSKQLRERNLNDIRKVLVLPEGRRLLWRIMGEGKIFCTSPAGNSEIAARVEGERVIGLKIFADIMEVKPEMFLQMQREYKSEQESIKKQFPIEAEEF